MIQLFHKGSSHIVNGITCEMCTVNEYGFEHLFDAGWCLTPEECYLEEKKEVPKETVAEAIEEAVEEVKEAVEAVEKVKDLQEKKTAAITNKLSKKKEK